MKVPMKLVYSDDEIEAIAKSVFAEMMPGFDWENSDRDPYFNRAFFRKIVRVTLAAARDSE